MKVKELIEKLKEFDGELTFESKEIPAILQYLSHGDCLMKSFYKNCFVNLDEIELSTRTRNCLKYEGLERLGQLALLSDARLLKIASLGRKSLNEIKELLKKMEIDGVDYKKVDPEVLKKLGLEIYTWERNGYSDTYLQKIGE